MSDSVTTCRYCTEDHPERFLCDPVKQFLDAMYARSRSFDIPDVEFADPVQQIMGAGFGDVVLGQFVVQSATIPVAGVIRPAIIFTGRSVTNLTDSLPRWIYVGDDQELDRAATLVRNQVALACSTAKRLRKKN